MSIASINISVDSEIEAQAHEVFASLGLDMTTAINIFLEQTVRQHRMPLDASTEPAKKVPQLGGREGKIEVADDYPPLPAGSIKANPRIIPQLGCMKGKIRMADDFDAPLPPGTIEPDPTKVLRLGCMEGKIWMADDFDAPLEEFEEYM